MNNGNCYNEYCNGIGNINNFNKIIKKKKSVLGYVALTK